MSVWRASVGWLMFAAGVPLAARGEPLPPSSPVAICATVDSASLHLDSADVASVAAIAAGRFAPTAVDEAAFELPAFCRVTGVARPSADSEIHFEVWIPPQAAWNGKLVATGNGGYNPALSYGDMAYALRQGYAVIGGDTGHAAAESSSLAWGAGHPEKIIDWGRRSIHATLQPGRQIVAQLQRRAVARSYFYGCSTGGHQAYAEAQSYPHDFDGIIAGAPANNWVGLSTESLWRYRSNRTGDAAHRLILTPEKAELLQASAIAACDALDGITDGVIADPRACTPARRNLDGLLCSGADAADCLTSPQIAAAKALYRGATHPRTGAALYPGPLPGTEAGWPNSWRDNAPARLGFWGLWARHDPQWSPWQFDFDHEPAAARARLGGMVDAIDPDLSAFKSAGGKLITYQGWADPVISALDTINYYENVRSRQGSQAAVDAFFRLFLVPGMGHCGGGPGANVFGNAGAAAPVPTASNDLLMALDRWVEAGKAPARLTAVEPRDGTVVSTRALCAYPRRAAYRGSGSGGDEASFVCR